MEKVNKKEDSSKKLNNQIKMLNSKIEKLNKEVNQQKEEFSKIFENLKMREYLVSSGFLGTLKNKDLIYDFKSERYYIPNQFFYFMTEGCSFEEVVNKIKDFDFNLLCLFYEKLKTYEEKQYLLNKYKK
jgi:hypothetical protein